jgi:hypothetical protein
MTATIARLILAMLILPATGAVFLLTFLVVLARRPGAPPSFWGVLLVWAVVYTFVATYWIGSTGTGADTIPVKEGHFRLRVPRGRVSWLNTRVHLGNQAHAAHRLLGARSATAARAQASGGMLAKVVNSCSTLSR